MLWVLVGMAAIWLGGGRFGLPPRLRATLVGLTWAAALLILLTVPEASRPRGGAVEWIVLGGLGLAVWIYARWIASLRRRVPAVAAAKSGFSGAELDRYSRHILLHEVGGPGQQKLRAAKVLVIGAGGLGSPALLYLAAAGVGVIGVIDDDAVEASNLQRQVIHTDASLGLPKVQSAARGDAGAEPASSRSARTGAG